MEDDEARQGPCQDKSRDNEEPLVSLLCEEKFPNKIEDPERQ